MTSIKTAYPKAMAFPGELTSAPSLSVVIDETIARFTERWHVFRLPSRLQFSAELERMFEAETRNARVGELRFTVSAAIGFMCVTTAMYPTLVPDLGWLGLKLRLVSSTVFLVAVYLFGKVSAGMREAVLAASGYVAVNVIVALPSLSNAPFAPYGIFLSFLAVLYANTTFPMRFGYAWPYNLLAFLTIAVYLHFDAGVSRGLAGAMMFMGVVGGSYTLLANYRMERSARLGYLLASKEALRLFALHRDRDQLEAMSSTDALTGIANRGMFDRRLAALFDGTAKAGSEIHLIMLDVDFFKRYNDHYGHPSGDACLRSVAAVITRVMRGEKDFVFRYGGEEFGALLVEMTRTQAAQIAERIRSAVERAAITHANREDGLRVLTVSVGVANVVIGGVATANSLMERSDQCLYAAKRAGRNRVSVSTEV